MLTEKDLLALAVEEAINAVSSALRPLVPKLDSKPNGVEQVALIAVLRTYADLLSEELPKEAQEETLKLQETITKVLKGS